MSQVCSDITLLVISLIVYILTVPVRIRDLEIMNTVTCEAHIFSIPAVHWSRQSLGRQYWYNGGQKVNFQIVFAVST